MRIISGSARGRRLTVPPSGTRPTSDRVREALFSSLDVALGDWSLVRFLDLCAGSGAVGLEALSRGAESATLVEQDRRCVEILRRNAAEIEGKATVVVADACAWTVTGGPFDVVYVDPPYGMGDGDLQRILGSLAAEGALAAGALVVVERSARAVSPWPESGWEPLRRRDYGDTTLWYGRRRREA